MIFSLPETQSPVTEEASATVELFIWNDLPFWLQYSPLKIHFLTFKFNTQTGK